MTTDGLQNFWFSNSKAGHLLCELASLIAITRWAQALKQKLGVNCFAAVGFTLFN